MRKIPHFAAAFTLLATSVFAENVTAADPQGMVAALQELGYRATLDRSSNGRPFIESSYLDEDFDPWLDFYFVANAPIQMDTFELIIAQWGRSMGQFKEHIDF